MDGSFYPIGAIVIVVVSDTLSNKALEEDVWTCVEQPWRGSDRRLAHPSVIKLTYTPVSNSAHSVQVWLSTDLTFTSEVDISTGWGLNDETSIEVVGGIDSFVVVGKCSNVW